MCDLNIDVNDNVCSNILVCYTSVVFLVENILSINLKVHFPRWRVGYYGILPVMNRSVIELPETDAIYSTKESEN